MTQTFLAIQGDKIIGRFITAQGVVGVKKSLSDTAAEIVEIPDESPAKTGLDRRMYDEALKLRPVSELVKEGFVVLKPDEKLDGETIIKKTLGELLAEGLAKIPVGMMYDLETDSLVMDQAYVPTPPDAGELSIKLQSLEAEIATLKNQIAAL